jgi:hypothetical protein
VHTLSLSLVSFDELFLFQRLPKGRIYFPLKQKEYESIQDFVEAQKSEMGLIPFITDTSATRIKKEDEEKRMRYVIHPDVLMKEEISERGVIPEDLKENPKPYSTSTLLLSINKPFTTLFQF